jgi:hypothetical protein
MDKDLDWLDFFHGGVPPYQLFRLASAELAKLVAASDSDKSSTTVDVCFIGLAAYFEAFCKDQFAAILNACPEILSVFSDKRPEATLPLKVLPEFIRKLDYRIGSLVAEQYDFGSAKAVNGMYHDLLTMTPFSKSDARDYGKFLNDRNLLVHHGGIYTQKYQGQCFRQRPLPQTPRIYFDSLVITTSNFEHWWKWADRMARKIAELSRAGVEKFVKTTSLKLSLQRNKAIQSFTWFD